MAKSSPRCRKKKANSRRFRETTARKAPAGRASSSSRKALSGRSRQAKMTRATLKRWPRFRFTRKFWEFYLSYIFRGKELHFEFEVVKRPRE